MQFVDLQRQYQAYQEEIDGAIAKVLQGSQYIMGPEIKQIETILSEFVGVEHCITCGSGTEGLQLALMALEIGPGDEVITVPFTWISTAEAISLVGATPVFVDICPETFNIDIDQIGQAITSRTKAIIPVSLFGQMPDLKRIEEFGLPVIEDGAQSFGATRDGERSCGVTLMGVTSFFPSKPLGCYGDGGAVFTSDGELAHRLKAMRTHGGIVRHHHPYLGMNSRFDTLQAAVLLAKWPHFAAELKRRRALAKAYDEAFGEVFRVPALETGDVTHVYAQYTLRLPERDEAAAYLAAQGIPTAIYYPTCLHQQPVFAPLGWGPGSFPQAEKAASEVLSLPLHPFLTDEAQSEVIEAVLALGAEVGV
ncbi:MAG: DegT/DnrJ/EryC1/StrS family aminotransferase [Verrucomicrobia bacterium]|nr:DegT/DnrJ/EryC1/StrS family aminotransferase [Verrucomicrobiota bacterium]